MEESKLVEQLLADSKKRTVYARVTAFAAIGIFLVVSAVCMLTVPKVSRLAEEADTLLTSAETAMSEISTMTTNITQTSTGLNTFITDNSQTISDAISGINEIDITTLNDAIQDLKDAVEPFANLMNRFK